MFKLFTVFVVAVAFAAEDGRPPVGAGQRRVSTSPTSPSDTFSASSINPRFRRQVALRLNSYDLATLMLASWLCGLLCLICLILCCKQSVDHGGWLPCCASWLRALAVFFCFPCRLIRDGLLRLWWWATLYLQPAQPAPEANGNEVLPPSASTRRAEEIELPEYPTYSGMRVVTAPGEPAGLVFLAAARPLRRRSSTSLSSTTATLGSLPPESAPSPDRSPSPSPAPTSPGIYQVAILPTPAPAPSPTPAGYIRVEELLTSPPPAPDNPEMAWYQRPLAVTRNPNL